MPNSKLRVNQPKHQRAKRPRVDEPDLRSRREIEAARRERAHKSEGPALESLAGAVIAGPIGYLAAEGIMNDNRHPIHWVITAGIGVIGYAIGAGVYRWREGRL